jgi:peptidoglycan-associated lipoprotein
LSAEQPAAPIRPWLYLVVATLVLGVVVVGCAKRPALTQATSPAPSGAALAPQPSPPPPVAQAPPPAATAPAEQPSAAPAPAPAPLAAPPAAREFAAVPELRDIHFDFDRYNIRPGDAEILRANARWLQQHSDQLVLIEGHCDERGTNEYNQALGDRRAKATMNFLVGQGVKADRMTTISYGEERPICTEHNESCWKQNRRAHLLVKPQ